MLLIGWAELSRQEQEWQEPAGGSRREFDCEEQMPQLFSAEVQFVQEIQKSHEVMLGYCSAGSRCHRCVRSGCRDCCHDLCSGFQCRLGNARQCLGQALRPLIWSSPTVVSLTPSVTLRYHHQFLRQANFLEQLFMTQICR